MAQTAPFHNAMRLGQGYNSYTQELRLDRAVKIVVPRAVPPATSTAEADQINRNATPQSDRALPLKPDIPSLPNAKASGDGSLPPVPDPKDFADAAMVARNDAVLRSQVSSEQKVQRFSIPPNPVVNVNQSVTFSIRSISNMSDIMDALNISASTSIKYGTIHGNGSAAFVNEDKVLDSQMNYLVSVRVNNEDIAEPTEMTFYGINDIPPEKFTEVYGDCFIAGTCTGTRCFDGTNPLEGFQTGGEFNAIISVDCHDKSKAGRVKEAIDLQLAVPPVPGLEIGGGESFDKRHSELLRGIEMTISVNWTGGGELKPPGVPWDLETVIAAANAYPSMVARSAAKISAILRPYTSLPTFVSCQYERSKDYAQKAEAEQDKENKAEIEKKRDRWVDKSLILNYAPCQLYTNDLFNAYMSYKKLWKRISYIMSDTSKWRVRTAADVAKRTGRMIYDSPMTAKDYKGPIIGEPIRQNSKPPLPIPEDVKQNGAPNGPNPTKVSDKPIAKDFVPPTPHVGSVSRFDTFPVNDPSISPEWNLDDLNRDRTPISLDPVDLNEARLLCREAMTLITEEAYSLVCHPDLAYADYDKKTKMTKMRRPIYMYPEVLKARLPTFIRNDAATDRRSRDPVILKLKQYDNNDLWANLVGDNLNPQRTYMPFVSLERNESTEYDNALIGLSIHAYSHNKRYHFSQWWAESDRAIGGIGFRFENDSDTPEQDGCTQWEGHYDFDDPRLYKKLVLRNRAKDLKKSMEQLEEKHHHRSMFDAISGKESRANKFDEKESNAQPKVDLAKAATEDRNITKIEIFHIPGTGRIAGVVFHDSVGPTELAWKQWEETTGASSNMHREEQFPPKDGTKWKFVGLMGDWDHGLMGRNKVLARVSGIWRKA
jgi:hypothetical protein